MFVKKLLWSDVSITFLYNYLNYSTIKKKYKLNAIKIYKVKI